LLPDEYRKVRENRHHVDTYRATENHSSFVADVMALPVVVVDERLQLLRIWKKRDGKVIP